MLKALFYIFFFLAIGELIKYLFNMPIAGDIIGMILIFLALRLKILKLEIVKPASDKLIKYLVLFFVPYGVGIMMYFNILKSHWITILLAIGLSTIITLYVTAIIYQKLEKNV